jgi:prepilin-type processing-associated H-X9-DG protein
VNESHSKPRHRNRSRFFEVVLVALVAVGFLALGREFLRDGIRAKSIGRLSQIGVALLQYADRDPEGYWPPVTWEPEPFVLDPSLLRSRDLPESVFLSPKRNWISDVPIRRRFFYLGYAFLHEDAAVEALETMRRLPPEDLRNGEPIPTDHGLVFPFKYDVASQIIDGLEFQQIEESMRDRGLDDEAIEEKKQEYRESMEQLRLQQRPLSRRFWEWLMPVAHATSYGIGPPGIPAMVEHPGLYGDGGHVLFMDGHVEFMEYPGEFPMTGRFIAALESFEPASD